MRTRVLVFTLVLAVSSVTALATHHSFAAYFDTERPFSVNGTIVKVDWVNPVVFVHLRVEDKATGQTTTWAFEGDSLVGMGRRGLDVTMFKEGERITVIGFMGKPGTNLSETVGDPELAARVRAERAASAAQFEFPDGRRFPLFAQVPQPLPQ